MNTSKNVNLKPYNTLSLSAQAEEFVKVDSVEQLVSLAQTHREPELILGEGSNLLLTRDIPGLILKNEIMGKQIVRQTNEFVWLSVNSGENWHDLVNYTVENNWGGIENLALIPGVVGAAPVQNIAAYGQNFSDVLEAVEYFDWHSGELITLDRDECEFGYRDSIFKHRLKGRAVICQVQLKLHKNPELETSYYSVGGLNDSLTDLLKETATKPYTIKHVYDAVVSLRSKKLPDWKTTPTIGSFFINPIVGNDKYQELSSRIQNLQCYPLDQLRYTKQQSYADDMVKVPVGRLLDHLGWRGRSVGNCLVTKANAAIFSHNGQATGKEFWEFTQTIRTDVMEEFGIELETEVVVV